MIDEGAIAAIASIKEGTIQAMKGDIEPTNSYRVDRVASAVQPSDYDGLIMPEGTVNADRLRMDADVRSLVTGMFAAGKHVGVICHEPWTLVEAGLVRGRTLTSFPSLRTDIRNAGGITVDEEVVTDRGLVSSRNPDDLPAFCAKIVEEFTKGRRQVHD